MMEERSLPPIQSRKGFLRHDCLGYCRWISAQLRGGNQPGQGSSLFRRSQRFGRPTAHCCVVVHLQQPKDYGKERERLAIQYTRVARRDCHDRSRGIVDLVSLYWKNCMIKTKKTFCWSNSTN
jgi:hypothetical protein